MRDTELPIANLFEEAEEDGEQVMQRAEAEKFEEEQNFVLPDKDDCNFIPRILYRALLQ